MQPKPVLQTKPHLTVTWHDDQSPAVGYLVVHDLVDGIATGGCRMRVGCTLREVEDLAYAMSTKSAAFQLPVGGAKGGIDFDPKDDRSDGVLLRFIDAMRPFLERTWVTAEDLGVSQHVLDAQFDAAGLGPSSYHAQISRSADRKATLHRVEEAMGASTPDGLLCDLIGGYGVAQAAAATLDELGDSPESTTMAVQGFGTIGGATALYAQHLGMTVVAVSDALGTVYDPDGLDIPALLATRNEWGEFDRSVLGDGAEELPRDTLLGLTVDVLVPAAVSYALTAHNHDQVNARIVVEGANAAATHEAELELAVRDIPVVPDFIANAGAVAWAWWILLDEDDDVYGRLRSEMSTLVKKVLTPWLLDGTMPRQTALSLAVRG
ncbi:Glu/Leu/Phe/Val family dehydrogenase [Tomitella fengzijianii]|uniref:Glutamate dehydrogenase n=1 Tax=Tomitella fengzijianii TaxID=2597660 RepID=A0A516X6S1_9ACTN|nr:Glu/Leu/Phe/Val dehydrogenase dimerization domain-containing protein [Tomitella fengzijianii]QDQ98755.1 glutamate dehydrogenase [Tomitella fengzijianii]